MHLHLIGQSHLYLLHIPNINKDFVVERERNTNFALIAFVLSRCLFMEILCAEKASGYYFILFSLIICTVFNIFFWDEFYQTAQPN